MTEIDQQVRDEIRRVNDGWPGERQFDLDLAEEAADEITRLRAEVEEYRDEFLLVSSDLGRALLDNEALRAEVERLTAALAHADEQAAKMEARIWPTAELNAALRADNARLREALEKINVGEGWAALIARAALTPEKETEA